MWRLENLLTHATSIQTEANGKWVPAKPIAGPLLWRIRDAWRVLIGRAGAFTWPEDDAKE